MFERALPPRSAILLVEADPRRVELIRDALDRGRWRKSLHVVADAAAALAWLRGPALPDATHPDVVLLGLSQLPDADARVVTELRTAAPSVPLVVVALLDGQGAGDAAGLEHDGQLARFVRDALVRGRVQRFRPDEAAARSAAPDEAPPAVHLAVGVRALLLTLPEAPETRLHRVIGDFRLLAARMQRLRREILAANDGLGRSGTAERQERSPWQLLDEVLERLRPEADRRGVRLEDDTMERDLPPAPVDAEAFLDALSALVTQTLDGAPPGSRVALTADSPGHDGSYFGDVVYFDVMDDGPGTAEAHIGDVFHPFAAAWPVVAAHRGELSFSSRPGRGRSLRLWIPYRRDP